MKQVFKRLLCEVSGHTPGGPAHFPFTDAPGLVCRHCGAKAAVFVRPNGRPNIVWSTDWRVTAIKDLIAAIGLALLVMLLILCVQ